MADERDVLISRQVALKAAVEILQTSPPPPDQLVPNTLAVAEDFAGWILSTVRVGSAPAPTRLGDPSPEPPDEWPEDEAIGPQRGDLRAATALTGFIMVEASPCPGCGTLRVIKDGTGKDGLPWKAYMCPAKQRDESNDAHPALFLKRLSG